MRLTSAQTHPPPTASECVPQRNPRAVPEPINAFAVLLAIVGCMTAVPLGEVRDRLSEYVAEVDRTHERVAITRHSHPAAVLISADDLAAIEETWRYSVRLAQSGPSARAKATLLPAALLTTTRSNPATGFPLRSASRRAWHAWLHAVDLHH